MLIKEHKKARHTILIATKKQPFGGNLRKPAGVMIKNPHSKSKALLSLVIQTYRKHTTEREVDWLAHKRRPPYLQARHTPEAALHTDLL
jgi:hypothetical protein